MILASHQPNFLPYMGVIYKAYRSDVMVLSDDVWYSRKGMHNYNFIRTKGGSQRITVPVVAHHDTRLCDVMVAEPERNIQKVCRTLREAYAKSKHFDEGNELVEVIEDMTKEDLRLAELNIELIRHILRRMDIDAEILVATEDLMLEGHKDDRILMMCKQTSADVYYSGTGAKAYHNEERYRESGINLVYSDYVPVVYPQKHGSFLPNMSSIDYVFNEGYRIPEVWLYG